MLYIILFLSVYCFVESLELPRGVPISKNSFYKIGHPFISFNGKQQIPWEYVNDNYCDTEDGSDEPGTSACAGGFFTCRDTRFKVHNISSIFVGDGFCDCCDGSDEYSGIVDCPNKCSELAEEHRKKNEELVRKITKGHELFLEQVAQLEVELAEAAVAEEARKAAAEEEEARKVAEEEEEARNATDGSHQEPGATDAAGSSDSVDDSNRLAEPTPDSKPVETAEPKEPSSYEAGYDEDVNVPEEDLDDDHLPTGEDGRDTDTDIASPLPPTKTEEQPPANIDYGPRQAFRLLTKECLTVSDSGHTYRLCPFVEVKQASLGSTWTTDKWSGTGLGRWEGWVHADSEDLRRRYSTMRFSGGAGCYEGPARSTTVHVKCGTENVLKSVSEPSRCEYVMHLETIAACFEDPAVVLKRLKEAENPVW